MLCMLFYVHWVFMIHDESNHWCKNYLHSFDLCLILWGCSTNQGIYCEAKLAIAIKRLNWLYWFLLLICMYWFVCIVLIIDWWQVMVVMFGKWSWLWLTFTFLLDCWKMTYFKMQCQWERYVKFTVWKTDITEKSNLLTASHWTLNTVCFAQ